MKGFDAIGFAILSLAILFIFTQPGLSQGIKDAELIQNEVDGLRNNQDSGFPNKNDSGIEFDIRAGAGYMSGELISKIGYRGEFFPLSELNFPLDVPFADFGASVRIAEKLNVIFDILMSISDDAGIMTDSDWGINKNKIPWWNNPYSLDVYSESDASLNSLIADAKVRYEFAHGKSGQWLMFAGLGYMRQEFDYEMRNLDQWYPSLNEHFRKDVGHDYSSGLVGEYSSEIQIPYIEIGGTAALSKRFSICASIGYSPYAISNDEDHHLLIPKRSEAENDGSAFLLALSGEWEVFDHLSAMFNVGYTVLELEGTETQYFSNGSTTKVDSAIESSQITASIGIAFSF